MSVGRSDCGHRAEQHRPDPRAKPGACEGPKRTADRSRRTSLAPMPGDVSNETAALAENRPSNVHLMGMPTGRNPIQEVVAPFEERGQGGSRWTAP